MVKNVLKNLLGAGAAIALAIVPSVSPAYAEGSKLDDMVSPVSNPVNFEDPRIFSDLRPIFVYHKLDNEFITQGGDVRIFALQARFKINDRLAFIATKDGYVDFNPNEVLDNQTGFANLGAGFKYAFYQDDQAGMIFSGGLRYEIATGDTDVLQGQGDGILNPFFAGAAALGPVNVMASTGFRLPFADADSTFYDFDLHVDTKLGMFYPLVELNWVHVIDAGNRLPIADEGQDFFNFGSALSQGKDMITMAVGTRVKFTDSLSWGLAYQFPLAHGDGTRVTAWRVTTDLDYTFSL